jgi:hypothetical protein
MAIAVISLIVQPATVRLYGRLKGGLTEHTDEIVAMCWRAYRDTRPIPGGTDP